MNKFQFKIGQIINFPCYPYHEMTGLTEQTMGISLIDATDEYIVPCEVAYYRDHIDFEYKVSLKPLINGFAGRDVYTMDLRNSLIHGPAKLRLNV